MKNLRNEVMSANGNMISIQYIYDHKKWHKLVIVDRENNIWRFSPAEKWMNLRFMYDNVNGQKIYEGVDTDGLGMMILVGGEVCGKTVEEITYEKWKDGNYYAFIRFAKEDTKSEPETKPEEKKYSWQICQDEDINYAFVNLHHEIVDKIVKFCKDHNLEIDEAEITVDGISGSIQYGSWQACTDSTMRLFKDTRSVKDIISGDTKPYLCSM